MSIIAKDKNEDVYIGVGLPLTHNKNGFFYRTKTSLEQAKSNIKNLLLTKKGERLGNPDFGSDLFRVVFEQEGDDIESKVEEAIRSAMSQWLPFIIVDEIKTQFSNINKNIINVSIGFSINVDATNKDKLSIDLANY
jgi:phage baseplate assembly protein W|tara:strand:- start:1976 stop:2386 length:411 start_codon:yes stop_codon:yes gene_type:complete